MSPSARILCLLVLAFVRTTVSAFSQDLGDANVLHSPVDTSVAVRFFYQPAAGSAFHVPLVFRAVGEKDPRLNTAPILDSGRTAYISVAEMQQLISRLAALNILWRQGRTTEVLGSFKVLPLAPTMDITVVSSHGTARAALDPKDICTTLSPLDSAFSAPRALWEFQLFRQGYGCKVHGLNNDAYPNRDANIENIQ
jgi:hypothetical protein